MSLKESVKILIIDDEEDLASNLSYRLNKEGFQSEYALNGTDGLILLKTLVPDLVLLDVMLPDYSGLEICRQIKADPAFIHTPVIMVSARGEEIDRVMGFEVGADDYVLKPFSIRELLLRLKAILRRVQKDPLIINAEILSFGILKLDKSSHQIWLTDEEIELTALEFKLLTNFIERKGKTQTRSQLLSDVWGYEVTEINTRTVDTHVKRLREKIGAAGAYIQTIRGVGYRFRHEPDELVEEERDD
jgi:two-component system phosphate regulon response regulator PhoB